MRWRPEHFSFRYNLLFPLYSNLPPTWAYTLAGKQAAFFKRKYKQQEQYIRQNLCSALPQASSEHIQQWLHNYFVMVEQEALDTWYLKHQPISNIVTLHNFEPVIQARQQGRKVLLTGGHFGRFWMAGPAMRAEGLTTGTITRDGGETNQHGLHPAEYAFRRFKLQQLQTVLGGPFLVEGNAARPLYKALEQHLITLIFDVPYAESHAGTIAVPFMGGTAHFPAGIYRIACHTQALVCPFYAHNLSHGKIRIDYKELLNPQDFNELEFMSLLAEQLEQEIRQYPDHWWLWEVLPLLTGKSC